MIDDDALFRRLARDRADAGQLTITPRDQQGDLPSWSPSTPVGGWSPISVFTAAVEYSMEEGADAAILNARRVILAAERALFLELPDSKRAQLVERLQGVDRHRDYFGVKRRGAPTQPTAEVDPDDGGDALF